MCQILFPWNSRRLVATAGFALAIGLAVFAGISVAEDPKPARAGKPVPGTIDWAPRFAAIDKNGDDRVSRAEWDQSELKRDQRLFAGIDADENGELTRSEAADFFGTDEQGQSRNKPSSPSEEPAAPAAQGPRPLSSASRNIGRLVADEEFRDLAGKSTRLSAFKDKRFLVIAMTSVSCPLSQKYLPTLASLEKTYADRGVAFLFVNPVEADRVPAMQEAIAREKLTGRYIHDAKGELARSLGALTTTEVLVLDSSRTVRYQGAVDDQYGFSYALDAPRTTYLVDALESLLSQLNPVVAATEAPGCTLDLEPAAAPSQVTYHNRISRIIRTACAECHHEGGVGPFALDSFDDLSSHRAMVAQVIERGQMPPWFAKPSGTGPSVWRNDRALSEQDKSDLLAWIKSDRPVGDPVDAIAPAVYPTEWRIGQPDAVYQLPEPVAIKATGTMPYVNVTVDPGLTEDKWVSGWEVLPTDRAVVHHVLVFVIPPRGQGQEKTIQRGDNADDERRGFFAAYVPGAVGARYEDGFAKRLPAGSRFRFQMHYTPNGKPTTDQTRLAVTFAKEPPRHELLVTGIVDPQLRIPPGASNHEEGASLNVPVDARITALMPHMHVRGKAFRYDLVDASGRVETLLDIPRYDFNWQLGYVFAEPKQIPAGSTLRVTGWFDNSSGNAANPDPSRLVRWGPQTDDEMLIGYVEYYLPGIPADERTAGLAGARISGVVGQIEKVYREIDEDQDLRISREEFARIKQLAPRLGSNQFLMDQLFSRLDKDADGFITVKELQALREGKRRQ